MMSSKQVQDKKGPHKPTHYSRLGTKKTLCFTQNYQQWS